MLEDIAGIGRPAPVAGEGGDGDAREPLQLLASARRRAIAVIALDWTALLILVVARGQAAPVFPMGATEDGIFALGLLAIAVHSGFRLGQLEKLSAVRRILLDIAGRERAVVEPPESR